jgi:hypothetical protein
MDCVDNGHRIDHSIGRLADEQAGPRSRDTMAIRYRSQRSQDQDVSDTGKRSWSVYGRGQIFADAPSDDRQSEFTATVVGTAGVRAGWAHAGYNLQF